MRCVNCLKCGAQNGKNWQVGNDHRNCQPSPTFPVTHLAKQLANIKPLLWHYWLRCKELPPRPKTKASEMWKAKEGHPRKVPHLEVPQFYQFIICFKEFVNGLKPLLRHDGTQPQSCHDVERRGHKQWPATIGRNTNDKPWKWVISGDLSTFWIYNISEFWEEWEASCIFLPLYKCKNYESVLFGSRFQVL